MSGADDIFCESVRADATKAQFSIVHGAASLRLVADALRENDFFKVAYLLDEATEKHREAAMLLAQVSGAVYKHALARRDLLPNPA